MSINNNATSKKAYYDDTGGVEHDLTIANRGPYQQAYYPPVPTGFTLFMRNFVPWQFVRFLVINFRILKLLMKTDHG